MANDPDGELPRIAVLGCGPKAVALHVLSTALSNLNRKTIHVVSWDMKEPASNWDGKNGYTNGECKLGTSPLKDATFPGTMGEDPELDKELVKFSWTTYLRCNGMMDTWVDRGCPACTHKQWADYMRWALAEAGADTREGAIEKVEPNGKKVNVFIKGQRQSETFDGFVFTGPGVPISAPVPHGRRTDRLLDAKTYWSRKSALKGKVCVIGTGESCAAILENLVSSNPEAKIFVITLFGYLPMRDEGYSANSVFSNPRKWKELPLDVRKRIINRADRGVLSPRCHEDLAMSQTYVNEIFGKVKKAKCTRSDVELELETPQGVSQKKFDFVIAAMGFDILSPLCDLLTRFAFPKEKHEIIEGMTYSLCLPGLESKIHVPGIAGLAQGPGFANLSCLNLTARRIFSAYHDP